MASPEIAQPSDSPVHEYDVSQYFPKRPEFTPEERKELRTEYGYVRAYYKMRPDEHTQLQRWLNQARMGVTYDVYLARSAKISVAVGVGLFVVGTLFAYLLLQSGLLGLVRSPVPITGSTARFISSIKELALAMLVPLVLGSIATALTYVTFYYRPRQLVASRERSINFILPHGIVFMYALSYGGMNIVEVIGQLSGSPDAYGALAEEFDMVRRDIELFGTDLYMSLRNLRNLTPSDNLEQFTDDMLAILTSGGDPTSFLEDQVQRYLRTAREEQLGFLETLSLLAEVFIVGFVAAPLFLIVILMVISVLGSSAVVHLSVLIYAGIPLGMAAFLVIVSVLSDPYTYPEMRLVVEDDAPFTVDAALLEGDEEYEEYAKNNRWRNLNALLADPLKAVESEPLYSLVPSVPVALLLVLTVLASGVIPQTFDGMLAAPIPTTMGLFVLPFLVVTVPLTVFYELKRSRETEYIERFADMLNVVSSANNMGIPLTDALTIVSRWSAGRFADELRVVRNDIEWNGDVSQALLRFANRLDVPPLSRTTKLIAEGGKATGEVGRILGIAAEDIRNQSRLLAERQRTLNSYVAVVVIGYLVFLMVIALMQTSYLGPISEIGAKQASSGTSVENSPIGFGAIPVVTYRMLFYHAVLVQAIGCGLLTGMLSANDPMAGLKYSVGLVLLATVVFSFI